jgi:hypothetical protein
MVTNVMYVVDVLLLVSGDITGCTEISSCNSPLVLIPRNGKACAFRSLFLMMNLICYGVCTWSGGF